MGMSFKKTMKEVMNLAWQLVKQNGYSMSEALKIAWANLKLVSQMENGVVRFYFLKTDGSLREAYGTLDGNLMPALAATGSKTKNDAVQTYYDTERGEFRCYRKANLLPVI